MINYNGVNVFFRKNVLDEINSDHCELHTTIVHYNYLYTKVYATYMVKGSLYGLCVSA